MHLFCYFYFVLARSSTARKITAIIEKEFCEEINAKEKEVLEIQERLHRASKIIHLLRYVIVADFYNRKQCHNSQNGEPKQTQIHPAIKQLIGKSPRLTSLHHLQSIAVASASNSDLPASQSVSTSSSSITGGGTKQVSKQCRLEKRNNEAHDEDSRPKKIPRYIPPKSGIPESQCPSRGTRHKTRKRIIIGNISKWIPPEWREDAASHKWTMYVRGDKENPDISGFVSKVRFFLHPSYRPNDVVEVTSAPFCLSRRGWGEFPLRVQLHFRSALNKPMDIIHHLKLDRTYTGLQTLGSETLVDIWIYADSRNSRRNAARAASQDFNESDGNCKVKVENYEDPNLLSDFTSNVSVNESSKSGQNKNNEVIVKKEFLEDVESENLVHATKLLFCVELDHDYCGSKYLNISDGNVTIDHSATSTGSSSQINSRRKEDTEEFPETNNITRNKLSMNGYLTNVKIKQELEDTDVPLANKVDPNLLKKVVPLSCSKIHSNFRPLEISIPPLFEPSVNKHVLVVRNNKTISVDIAGPDYDPTKSKANLTTASRGVSLLKKPPAAESKIQVRNLNGAKTQQGAQLQISKGILLNVNSNVPVLKIAEKKNLWNDVPLSEKRAIAEEMLRRQRITLGKDKYKLQSKKELYNQVLQAIKTVNVRSVQGMLRFIIRRMPMITWDAFDCDYRSLHPYACISEEEYFSYSEAKRNACEWYRAKMIRNFLRRSFKEEELWSTKEIMIWTRLHGYTPLCSTFNILSMKQQKSLPHSTIAKCISSTCTQPSAFYKWLEIYSSQSNDNLFDCYSRYTNELDIEVDVVNTDNTLENRKRLNEKRESKEFTNATITVLELEKKLVPFHDFVCETAREIGIKLTSEEIVPTVVHCAAGRMIMRVCFYSYIYFKFKN